MIKRSLKYVIILFLLVLFQSSNFINNIALFGKVVPDFVLTFLIYISLTSSFIAAESFGFFTGIILDILSNVLIGINGFTLTVISSLLNLFKTKLFVDKSFSIFIIVFITTIINRILFFLLTIVFSHKISFYDIIIKITLPEALYTAVVAVILFPVYNYIFSRK